jgi:hypothetical protein
MRGADPVGGAAEAEDGKKTAETHLPMTAEGDLVSSICRFDEEKNA